jgi:monoamine oxidase
MARSRLGNIVAKAFRTVRGARAAGVPVLEYYESVADARRVRQVCRRQILLGASSLSLAACASTLGGNASQDGSGDGGAAGQQAEAGGVGSANRDGGANAIDGSSDSGDASASVSGVVGIVGAGMAGVHCAYLLKQAGVSAMLYEAQNRIGGRMFTDRTTFAAPDGQHCELGGELIDSDHTTILGLCQMLGIGIYDYLNDTPGLTEIICYVGGQALTMADILNGIGPICDQVNNAVGALSDGGNTAPTYLNPNGGGPVDAMSIKQWFDSFGFSGPTRTVLELTYTTEMGLDTDQQSAWNFIWDIAPDSGSQCTPFDDPSYDERYTTQTGNDAIPTKLAALLDPSQINLGVQLVAVAQNSDGRIALTLNSAGSITTAVFDHVVLALPFSLLRNVDMSKVTMSAVKSKCIQTLGYGTGAKLMTGFGSRPWRTGGATYPASNGETTTDLSNMQYTWETSRLQAGSSGIITSFFGGSPGVAVGTGTPQLQRDTFLASFNTVFPGAQAASNGNVSRMHWPSFKWTLGSYACYLVGQYTTISGAEVERVGNIHFAGEHTAVASGFNGFMEGAARSGAAAAAEVLADLGVKDAGTTLGLATPPRFARPAERIGSVLT